MRRLWRTAMGGLLALLLAGAALPMAAQAHDKIKLKGFMVDVPGGSMTLPVAANVNVSISLGSPAVTIPFAITPATEIKEEEGVPPTTLTTGDIVEVKLAIQAGLLVATELELEDFPEFEFDCRISDVPGGSLALPPASDTTVQCTLELIGQTLPITLTPNMKREGIAVLTEGQLTEVEGIVRNGALLVTEIEFEGGIEHEDD